MSTGILLLRLALGMALALQGTAKPDRRGRHDTAAALAAAPLLVTTARNQRRSALDVVSISTPRGIA